MNFFGYVPLRRGLMAHTADGRISNTECLVLIVLIMLADKATGSGTINAPCLRTFLPELSYDAAKRALLSLEEKRYVYRHITPFSKLPYRFWVNRYSPSVGRHKMLQIDLTKVFETKDINDIQYVNPALGGAPEGALEGALDPAPHYKKRKEILDKKTNPIGNDESASKNDFGSTAIRASAKRTCEQVCAPPKVHPKVHPKVPNAQNTLTPPDRTDTSMLKNPSGTEGQKPKPNVLTPMVLAKKIKTALEIATPDAPILKTLEKDGLDDWITPLGVLKATHGYTLERLSSLAHFAVVQKLGDIATDGLWGFANKIGEIEQAQDAQKGLQQ